MICETAETQNGCLMKIDCRPGELILRCQGTGLAVELDSQWSQDVVRQCNSFIPDVSAWLASQLDARVVSRKKAYFSYFKKLINLNITFNTAGPHLGILDHNGCRSVAIAHIVGFVSLAFGGSSPVNQFLKHSRHTLSSQNLAMPNKQQR